MKLRLITKTAIFTNLVVIVVMSFFAYFNIMTLEDTLMQGIVADIDKLSETIILSSHHSMLEGDTQRVHQMIKRVGRQNGVEAIRLINKNGRITFSTREAEFGLFVNKEAESCNMCHLKNGDPRSHATPMNSSRIFSIPRGGQVLGLAKAIYNEESCYTAACHFHPENVKILGVLDIVVSLSYMNELTSAFRNKIIALTISLMVLISVCLTLLMQKFVNYPVRLLVGHTQLLANGDLGNDVSLDSGDELGELATAFNGMTLNLRRAREELEEWGRNLEVKVAERTEEIREMQGHLIRSEKLASLGELVAGIAHELNNPLTGMLVYASLVHQDSRLHPELCRDMEMVIQETERCAKIVKGLLNFSRESLPQPTPSSLNGIIDVSLSLVGHQSFFHDVEIIREQEEQLPLTLVDHNQVEQVLINLLVNAAQAMPQGGTLTIATGATADGHHVFVRVSDTGCGIPTENLGRIFDPFFSTKEKGTGLGLSLCYGIVTNNRGKIDVESRVGEGTTFVLTFASLTGEELRNGADEEGELWQDSGQCSV
ncbi:MAG TPA: ATP-binding protein [Geobacteraceae bacterium]